MATLAPNRVNTYSLVRALPLMEKDTDAHEFRATIGTHEIYIPTNFAGVLTVRLLSPANGDLVTVVTPKGKSHHGGADRTVRIEIPGLMRGTGYFTVTVVCPGQQYRLNATFDSDGVAKDASGYHIPWNFWFFPYADSMKHASARGGGLFRPLHKYEEAFGVTGVVEWEEAHHSEAPGKRNEWEGHCSVSALASIAFEAPPLDGVDHGGVHFTCEELKLLAAETFGKHGLVRDAWFPFKKEERAPLKSVRPDADPEAFGTMLAEFLGMLSRELIVSQIPVVMDLRDPNGVDPEAVWNHAVFKQRTRYWQPDVDDPTLTEGRVILYANADFYRPDAKPTGMPAEVDARKLTLTEDRVERHCRFRVRFQHDGKLSVESQDNAWLSVHAEAPRSLINPSLMEDKFGPTPTFMPEYAAAVKPMMELQNTTTDGNPKIAKKDVLTLLRLRPQYR